MQNIKKIFGKKIFKEKNVFYGDSDFVNKESKNGFIIVANLKKKWYIIINKCDNYPTIMLCTDKVEFDVLFRDKNNPKLLHGKKLEKLTIREFAWYFKILMKK